MKKTILFCLAAFISVTAFAQYKATDQGSSVKFTVKNFGFDVNGSFKGLQGDIGFDPANPTAATFDVTIDANTINTDNSLRDGHLRGDTYFDVQRYPKIQFASTHITGKNGAYKMTGTLTIKRTTKQISFPFTATATGNGYFFKGQFTINRKDFDVGGASTISDELVVVLSIVASKDK